MQNHDKLNQRCKQFLLELKEKPDPSQLYCLQLMEWGLEKAKFHMRDSRLRNTLEELMGSNQAKAYRFLKLAEDQEEYEPVPDLEKVSSPEVLAWELLDLLDSKVNLHLKDYPRSRQYLQRKTKCISSLSLRTITTRG